jgi:hypothetical protein
MPVAIPMMPAPAEPATTAPAPSIYSRQRREVQQLRQQAHQEHVPQLHRKLTATDRVLEQVKQKRQAAAEGACVAASEALRRETQQRVEAIAMEDARVLLRDRLELRTGQKPMLL